MRDATDFHETGAKWFCLIKGVLAIAVLMAVLVVLFSVYRPPKPVSGDNRIGPALIAILVGAAFFALLLVAVGLWHQWRKPLRLSLSSRGILPGEGGPVIPWSVVDRVAFHWTGQRFERAPRTLQVGYSHRTRLSLLIYVRDSRLEWQGTRGLVGLWQRYWYRTPFVVSLAMVDATTAEIIEAIQAYAPEAVRARSGLLDV